MVFFFSLSLSGDLETRVSSMVFFGWWVLASQGDLFQEIT